MIIKHLNKILVSLLCLAIVVFILLKQQPSTTVSKNTTPKSTLLKSGDSSETVTQQPIDKTEHEVKTALERHDEPSADVIKQNFSAEMRAEINAKLNPPNASYPEIKTAQGGYVDLSQRAASVSVAYIDENGNTIVTDITQPLTEQVTTKNNNQK
ncbi:MAG: hypothetical protein ACPG3T_05680 [Pseudomonadales bacterium]